VLLLTPSERSKVGNSATLASDPNTNQIVESKMPLQQLEAKTFPLPQSLVQKLDGISERLYSGRGFCVLRGLEDAKRSEEEQAILFVGISSHVAGTRGFQDVNRTHVLGASALDLLLHGY